MNSQMILILGPTASGKNRLAFELAGKINAEIISIDSMKVYRRMDIGTAKPPPQARNKVKYHLIDVVEPSETFSVARFLELANAAVDQISSENKPVIACGGTAMYIKAMLYGLFEGPGTDETIRNQLKERIERQGAASLHAELSRIDPAAALRIHPNDQKRIVRALEVYKLTGRPISSFQTQFTPLPPQSDWKIIGLRHEKTDTAHRINIRVKKIIKEGLLDEVKSLLAEPEPLSKQARCAIGYAEIIDYLAGKTSLEDAAELIKKNTRKLAKAQRTWFKTFKNVNWLDVEPEETTECLLNRIRPLLADTGLVL